MSGGWFDGGTDDEGKPRGEVWIPSSGGGGSTKQDGGGCLMTLARGVAVVVAFVLVLFNAAPAGAHYQPRPGEGIVALTQRICGTSATWRAEAARNGLTGNMWLYMGRAYDVQCSSSSAPTSSRPAAAPAAPTAEWVNPVPGSCRPSGGGGQFGAPRSGYRHQGIDLGGIEGMRAGTPVLAPHSGIVALRGNFGNAGNQLQIRSGEWLFKLNHLSGFAVGVGQSVSAGQVVGYMGATGNATGVHLHIELWRYGGLVDPTNVLPVRC